MRRLLLVLAACSQPVPPTKPVPPAPEVTPIMFGETFQLASQILGQRRTINVYLPPDYAKSSEAFPVLYMPDGGMAEDFPHITGLVDVQIRNGVIRPMIVVGVENIERRHDLTPATSSADDLEVAPHAGGADTFRRFLRDELRPRIASHYRTTAETALLGESLAGLFVLETALVEPALFDTYIVVSPSTWWNDEALVKSAGARFASWPAGTPRHILIATGDDERGEGVPHLVEAFHKAPPAGLELVYLPMPEEHHATIYPPAAARAFRTLFPLPPGK
jgi:predicted alpha/beta superfamily hydrolase